MPAERSLRKATTRQLKMHPRSSESRTSQLRQITDVARPVVGLQQIQGLLVDRSDISARPVGVALHEILDQDQNVVFPFSQRRHFDGKHIQPIEESLAEGPIR